MSKSLLAEGLGQLLGRFSLPLPSSIAADEGMQAINAVTEIEMRRFASAIASVLLLPRLDELEEPVLSHLAAYMHTDWWDETWSVAAKRAFIRRQIQLHRKKGTPWAVEEAIAIVYGRATVKEWFRYGGEPGRFRLDVDVNAGGLDMEIMDRIEMMVEKYKRKSQHLDGVTFSLRCPGTVYQTGFLLVDERLTIHQYVPDEIELPGSTVYQACAVDILEVYTLEERP